MLFRSDLMNRIEKLINELCPNGVETFQLWELTIWDKKFNGVEKYKQNKINSYKYFLSSEFNQVEDETGDVYYISTGISNKKRYTTEEKAGDYLSEGEVVCIPWGGTPNVKYYKGKFVTGDNRICTSICLDKLSNKYLYYVLSNRIEEITSYYRGAGIQHPSMKSILDMKILVPPLEVQCEIVHILDNFTLLTAELTAELIARKKQFEYYRNVMFESLNGKDTTLGEICKFVRGPFGGALKKEIFVDDGYAVYEQQNAIYSNTDIRYFITEQKFNEMKRFEVKPNDLIMSCSGTIGRIFVIPNNAPKGIINQALLKLTPNENVDSHFLKYVFDNYLTNIMDESSRGGGLKNVPGVDVLKAVSLKLPSLEEQRELVLKLNIFKKYCEEIRDGLPAEIEMRKKQYEYYRDKLLSFK